VGELHRTRLLGGHGRARDLLPNLESLGHLLAIRGGGKPVASRAEVLRKRPIRSQEALCMSRRFEPLQAPLPLAGRLVGILRAVIQGSVANFWVVLHR
jgi:hypothetical protein